MSAKVKRHRIRFDASEEVNDAIKSLAERWNCKTNEAVTRAILDCLHRPLATSPEPPWAKEIKAKLNQMSETIDENFL